MLQKTITQITKLLKQYKCSIALILLLLIVALKPIDFAISIPIAIGAISVFFLYALLVFNRFYILTVFIFTIVISLDAYFAYAFSSYINMGFFASMLETNLTEATSMIGTAWFPALIILALLFLLFYFAATELRKSKFAPRVMALGFAICLLSILFIFKRGYDNEDLQRFSKEYPILVFHNLVSTYTPLFYGNIAMGMAYYDDMQRFQKFLKSDDRPLPFGVELDKTKNTPQTIFVIVGESSCRNHYSLYGYCEPTTPFLDSMDISESEEFSFYKGVSSSPITRDALRMIMSFATPHNINLFFDQKSIIDLAHDAGYESIWISNQGHSSLDDTYIGYLSSSCNHSYFKSDSYLASDDLDLPPILQSMLNPNRKQFIVLHMVGSHANYNDRYDEIDKQAINSTDNRHVEYDRTIHHTDRFLSQIYSIAQQNQDYTIYYTSDHGEIVGVGHGLKKGKAQFQVPLLTINKSSVAVDTIVSRYLHAGDQKINNINTTLILAEIMGFSISDALVVDAIEAGTCVYNADHTITQYRDVEEFKK